MLSNNDLFYVAATVQPHDKTENNLAAYNSGFLGFDFCGPRPSRLNPEQRWELNRVNRENDFFAEKQKEHAASLSDYNADHLREAAARSGENNRLVQGRKSPTRLKVSDLSRRVARLSVVRWCWIVSSRLTITTRCMRSQTMETKLGF